MTSHLSNLARSRENLYFLNKEAEVIDRLRDVGRLEREREMISEAIGIANEATLRELQNLGFSRDTVLLLPVVPLVHVAWGDGRITDREACFIRKLAQIRGITRETPASALLETWLQKRPPEDFFISTLRLIRLLLGTLAPHQFEAATRDLVSCCTHVAEISRSILGLGSGMGQVEQHLVETIASELQKNNEAAVKRIVSEL